MKRVLVAALAVATLGTMADTPYPISSETARANRKAVEAKAEGAYWKGWPLAVASVDAMSGIRFLPDVLPAGGDFANGPKVILAKGEYEDGAVCLFGFKDLKGVEIVPADLVSKRGAKILAAETDVKVVKTWYQQGTAWYGAFMSDVTRRVLTPELLLHDEAVVHVDYVRKENFLLCNYQGEQAYRWISTTGPSVDHSGVAEPDFGLIADADAPKPFELQKDCFKEIVFTFHAPKEIPEGIYRGAFAVKVGGEKVGELPVALRVLPFALPKPATFRDPNRRFYPSGSCYLNLLQHAKLAENLSAHGVDTAYVIKAESLTNLESARKVKAIMDKYDLNVEFLPSCLPQASVSTSFPPEKWNRGYQEYLNRIARAKTSMKVIREVFGEKAIPHAYAADEAPPEYVRAERASWQAFQGLGAHIIAATGYHPYLLFNCDQPRMPQQPRLKKRLAADALHAANPDCVVSWYGDPHSGPENPDYTRRVYGWVTWRNNFDMFAQFIIARDDWTEFYVHKEPQLRGLQLAYPAAEGLIDTLEWEGVREAVDDIRYGTLLRQLAEQARQSSDMDVRYEGLAAATWLAQVDFERSSLDSLRMETVRRILAIREKIGSGK